MAQLLTKKESAAKARSMSPEVAKALARLSSGLYVVTAGTEGTAKGAMVASWVSQASFEPLGLSIAVAKDRAIESLMQVSTSCNTASFQNFVWLSGSAQVFCNKRRL